MKLTWFGEDTVRVHTGGAILVFGADRAPPDIDAAELISGADRVVASAELDSVQLLDWRPRAPKRLLDGQEQSLVQVWSAAPHGIVVDAMGEPPLLLFPFDIPQLGRWAEQAVVLLAGSGEELARLGLGILAQRSPRLLALASDDDALDYAIPKLRDVLDGTGLVAVERGLALEV
jgi:hypothetical protein